MIVRTITLCATTCAKFQYRKSLGEKKSINVYIKAVLCNKYYKTYKKNIKFSFIVLAVLPTGEISS